MGNVLSWERRVAVVCHLVEGAGVNATSRLTGVSKEAILSLLLRAGEGCDRLHDRMVRDLPIREVQADEIWSFVRKKAKRVAPMDPPDWGDAYTFLAMARTQKLMIAYRVGKRDEKNTRAFIGDLRARLSVVPLLCTDGWSAYPSAVGDCFSIDDRPGAAVDYVVLNKEFNGRRIRDDEARYEPPRNPTVTKRPIFGAPDASRASTSHVERANLTVRMHVRRFTRLCNGYSKSLAHHKAAVSLHVAFYNFVRVHEALRVTPAMEAGLTKTVWTVSDLLSAALGEPIGKAPTVKPLRLPDVAQASARALPEGRGWLRAVPDGSKGGSPGPRPPSPSPAAPEARAAAPLQAARKPWKQLDLFSWTPKGDDL